MLASAKLRGYKASRELWALLDGVHLVESRNTKEQKYLCSVSNFVTNSVSKTTQPVSVSFIICQMSRPNWLNTHGLKAHIYVSICGPQSLTSNLGKSVRICESLSW